jgi:hypothetical protein
MVGSADLASSQSDRVRTVLCCVSEASDLSVAKPVVDEHEKLSGGGDPADVAATSFCNPGVEVSDLCASVIPGYRFDCRPADQPRALFADPLPLALQV